MPPLQADILGAGINCLICQGWAGINCQVGRLVVWLAGRIAPQVEEGLRDQGEGGVGGLHGVGLGGRVVQGGGVTNTI